MNWKSFFIGLGVGIAGGYAARELLVQKTLVQPEKALANAKELFKQNGPISGSWIYMKPKTYQKQDLTYTVYKGGISRMQDGQLNQYEFVADAKTGCVIDATKLS